ncbi:hypothetical protein BHM03_00025025 [Ensete ventricosum]|nr:hypothetical protein BHM03_00025025 [Ensete ventricosum]
MLCADQTITPNPENTGLGSMASRYPDSVPRWSDSTRYRVRCEVPTQAELPVTSEIFSRRNTKTYCLSYAQVNEDITTTVDSLRTIMDKEEEKRRIIRLRNLERHSQFSGTFTRFGVDGSKTLFKRNPTSASGNGIVKVHNVQRGPLKRIAWDHDNLPPAKENILELLYEFLNQFLSGGYNGRLH